MAVPQPHAAVAAETPLEAHLRRVIESQPVCLMRLAEDGAFLAVNEAALHLLGAERLDLVLSTSFLTLLQPEFHDEARAFLHRMAGGERGSIEVVMAGLGAPPRTMQVHGVGMVTPIDGLRSVLCSVRDVTELRLLEQALVDGAAREDSLRAELAAERETLTAAFEEARHHQAAAADTSRLTDVEERLAGAVARYTEREAELQADLQALRTALDAATADHLTHLAAADAAREAAEAGARESSERHQAAEARWQTALEEAAGAHARELADLRDALAALETTARDAEARERDLVSVYEAEKARWQQAADEASAAHEQELGGLRTVVASLEAAADDAAARERDVVSLYEAEKARWQQAADEASAAQEQELGGLRTVVASLEAAVDDAAARERDVVSLYEADKTRWQHELEEAAARHRLELEQSRAALAALEAAASDAAARELAALSRREADEARWRGMVDDATRAVSAAHAEARALEVQWQHASRLADAARLTASVASDLETALAMATAGTRRLLTTVPDGEARTLAEQALGASLEATLLARQLRRRGVPPPLLAIAPAVHRLEAVLGAMLQPDVALTVLTGAGDIDACIQPDDLEHLLMLLVTAQRAAMREGGTVSLEIAEVTIDEAVARDRGVPPGGYALLALHASGAGLDTALPDAVFVPFVPADAWAGAGPAFSAVQRLVAAASGHMWATREGKHAIALELYLPRAEALAGGTPLRESRS